MLAFTVLTAVAAPLEIAKIDTGIFIPAIKSAEQNGNAADALKAANDQLNQLLGCP